MSLKASRLSAQQDPHSPPLETNKNKLRNGVRQRGWTLCCGHVKGTDKTFMGTHLDICPFYSTVFPNQNCISSSVESLWQHLNLDISIFWTKDLSMSNILTLWTALSNHHLSHLLSKNAKLFPLWLFDAFPFLYHYTLNIFGFWACYECFFVLTLFRLNS